MGKSNTFSQNVLDLIFLNADITLVGDAAGIQASATEGNLYAALHTGDPGAAGDQTTNEAAYTSYARVAIPRNSSYWSRTAQTMSNLQAVTFPQATGGSETETYASVGTSISGTGKILWSGALSPTIAVSTGITPEIPIGDIDVTES